LNLESGVTSRTPTVRVTERRRGGTIVGPMRFSVLVETRLRPGIADPQGSTIERSLPALGFDGVASVRVGKAIRFDIDAEDEGAARARVEEVCRRFLINPVIEDADVTLDGIDAG
jgi:phosphoribosylformylglycinamidine synthase subunit PurS